MVLWISSHMTARLRLCPAPSEKRREVFTRLYWVIGETLPPSTCRSNLKNYHRENLKYKSKCLWQFKQVPVCRKMCKVNKRILDYDTRKCRGCIRNNMHTLDVKKYLHERKTCPQKYHVYKHYTKYITECAEYWCRKHKQFCTLVLSLGHSTSISKSALKSK